MRMKLSGGILQVIDYTAFQEQIMKGWVFMRKVKGQRMYECDVSMEALDAFRGRLKVALPDYIEKERQKLHRVQEAVDAERVKPEEELRPMVKCPVRKKLYSHQLRAVNMCMLTFGIVDPSEVT